MSSEHLGSHFISENVLDRRTSWDRHGLKFLSFLWFVINWAIDITADVINVCEKINTV